ncbi:MarR family winged helix-turn-helix transcriptional regulator [Chitinimonas sp.]|uniref:MarR family winged helix-turn-helix transcriptional regulator n=1 Tax=Chitinimonas sp. TaxID=1934313 RepID=UPI0035B47FBA
MFRPPISSTENVMELIHDIMHRFRARQYQALRDSPHAITHMEAKTLNFFRRRPGATQRDLAEHSGRDKAQLARLVKNLKELGLLRGEVDESDRRNLKLHLTASAEALLQSLQAEHSQLAELAMAGLDASERSQLEALLLRVQANLHEKPPAT